MLLPLPNELFYQPSPLQLLIAELGQNPMLCVQSTLEPAELQKPHLDPNVGFGFTNSSESAAFSGRLCCYNLCGVPSSSLLSPSWQGLLLSSLFAIQMGMCCLLKSCLCQALICCKACRALYASTRLRCNESSINYCADNAPLIWMLSVLWKQQPSKASTAEHLLPSSKNWTNLVQI